MWILLETSVKTGSTARERSVLHEYLEKLEKTHNTTKDPLMRSTMLPYNLCLDLFKFVKSQHDAIVAEKLLEKIQKMSEDGILGVKPTTRSSNEDGNKRAENVFERTLSLYAAGHLYDKPTITTFKRIIYATSLLGDPDRMKAILGQMEELSRSEEHKGFRPDISSYNSLLDAYARCTEMGSKELAEKAGELLAIIEEMPDVRPNIYTYNVVMRCYVKCGDVGKVESMISALEENAFEGGEKDPMPNTASYNTLLDAIARSDEKEAPEKAEATLRKMGSLYDRTAAHNLVRPNLWSFISVLKCHTRHGNAQHAEDIVNHMENLRAHKEFEHIYPTVETYTYLIDAWRKSGDPLGPAKVESIQVKIKDLQNQSRP